MLFFSSDSIQELIRSNLQDIHFPSVAALCTYYSFQCVCMSSCDFVSFALLSIGLLSHQCVCVFLCVSVFIYLFYCKCLLKYVLTICNTSIKWGGRGKHGSSSHFHICISNLVTSLEGYPKLGSTPHRSKAFSCETYPCVCVGETFQLCVCCQCETFLCIFSLRKSLDVLSLQFFLFHCVILFQCNCLLSLQVFAVNIFGDNVAL